MQLRVGDAQELSKRKRTRCEVFVDAMNQVVPWKQLLALIAPFYPKAGRPGRQPDALETLLRIHFFAAVGCPERPGHGRSALRHSAHAPVCPVGRA